MDMTSALSELEAVAAKLEVQVIYDHLTGDGMGTGGLCKVKGKWRVIIERRCSPGERVSILAQALSRFDMETVFLSPAVREYVDHFRPASPSAPTSASQSTEGQGSLPPDSPSTEQNRS